jgi:hypothetical protein
MRNYTIDELKILYKEYHNIVHSGLGASCDEECGVKAFLEWLLKRERKGRV